MIIIIIELVIKIYSFLICEIACAWFIILTIQWAKYIKLNIFNCDSQLFWPLKLYGIQESLRLILKSLIKRIESMTQWHMILFFLWYILGLFGIFRINHPPLSFYIKQKLEIEDRKYGRWNDTGDE